MKKNAWLVKREGSTTYKTPALILDEPSQIKAIDSPLRSKIMAVLGKKAMYPAEIARELRIPEQKAYYHLKQLSIMGMIEVVETRNVRGTIAKRFKAASSSFAVSFADKWEKEEVAEEDEREEKLAEFLDPFVKNGRINATIVVGSPDPHGPYRASARDGHYGVEVGIFLGRRASLTHEPAVALDVNISIQNSDKNMIVVGGPVTNMIMKAINDHMLVRFSDKPPWGIISKRTGKEYVSENTGIIARITAPGRESKKMLVIAGIRGTGTEAAVVALTRHYHGLIQTFSGQEEWYRVVQGFDTDGDGRIDSIDFAE
ncbi:S-layer protein [Candidatus Woesearchaeota archaeon]|nr:MAG: S-layer protein [Candidatus Woesearchaeota archaeon]